MSTGDPKNFVVGNDDCSFGALVTAINPSESCSFQDLPKVARALNISSTTIDLRKIQLFFDILSITDVFEKMLREFRMRLGAGATLDVLLGVFESLQMYDIRDRIMRRFGIANNNHRPLIAEEKAPEKDFISDKHHQDPIKPKKPDAMQYFPPNSKVTTQVDRRQFSCSNSKSSGMSKIKTATTKKLHHTGLSNKEEPLPFETTLSFIPA